MKPLERADLMVLLVAGVGLALAASFLWLHVATPFDGTRLKPGASALRPGGAIVTPLGAQPGELRSDDLVVAVDGRSLETWARLLLDAGAPRPRWQVGEQVVYTVERDGRRLDLPVTLGRYPMGTVVMQEWGTILFALVSFVVATLVLLRRRSVAARVLFLWAASILAATTWSFGLHVADIVGGVGFWLYKATTFGIYMLFWCAGLHFSLIFPEPQPALVRRPWLIPAIYLAPFVICAGYLAALWATSESVLTWLSRWSTVEGVLAAAYLAAMLGGVVVQYRRSTGTIARQKIRLVVMAGLLSGVSGLCLWNIPGLILGAPIIDANMLGMLLLPFPLALALAVVRHHLFDIDTLITRTFVYGVLTATVIAIYVVIVGYLGAVFHASGSLAISLIATGVVAVLFQPLRQAVQGGVNQLLYGERDDPYMVIARLGERLEGALAPDAVLTTIVHTIKDALKLPYVAIALATDDRGGARGSAEASAPVVVEVGTPRGELLHLALTYQHETVGSLLLAPRMADDAFAPADQRLLRDLARQAGTAVHAVQLTRDLQRSRERLVAAREEERRRLHRDLHDGLGPQLASLTLSIAAARELLRHNVDAADALLQELAAHTQHAVADVRRVVYDMRPPALDDLGLVLALREQAARYGRVGLAMTIDAPERLPPLPAAVEVAVYRIVQEALTNVVRHARAQRCSVRLTLGDALCVVVEDDGVGLPQGGRAGVGLTSMRERAAELGGVYRIESWPGKGTRIRAELPLEQEGVCTPSGS